MREAIIIRIRSLLLAAVIIFGCAAPGAVGLADSVSASDPAATTASADSTPPASTTDTAAADSAAPATTDTTTTPPATAADSSAAAQTTDSQATAASDTTQSDSVAASDSGSTATQSQTGSSTAPATDITVNNGVDSTAASGSATVADVTTGGTALSGNASAETTLLNVVQSTVNLGPTSTPAYFNYNVYGNVQGDITIDPAALGALPADTSQPGNITLASNTSIGLNNDINVSAASGNAAVSNSGNGGRATSGSAQAVANVVNIVNSLAAAGHSFVGTVNIYGNLQGDILLPSGFLDSLLATNAPTGALIPATISSASSTQINNNVTLAAASGDATVTNGGRGGSAASGNATTNLTILNLVGQDVVAKNDFLVFVNVLGQWYGLIMNAPAGTTAAELGSGIVQNYQTPAAQAVLSSAIVVNNNLVVKAVSGSATVTNQGRGGTATSGNASASANLANISLSQLALSDWFGLLFINVFGVWNGSFGVAKPPADPVPVAADPPATAGPPQLLSFTSKADPPASNQGGVWYAPTVVPVDPPDPSSAVLPTVLSAATLQKKEPVKTTGGIAIYVYMAAAASGGILIALRLYEARRQ